MGEEMKSDRSVPGKRRYKTTRYLVRQRKRSSIAVFSKLLEIRETPPLVDHYQLHHVHLQDPHSTYTRAQSQVSI
jgi:hypothetical protein